MNARQAFARCLRDTLQASASLRVFGLIARRARRLHLLVTLIPRRAQVWGGIAGLRSSAAGAARHRRGRPVAAAGEDPLLAIEVGSAAAMAAPVGTVFPFRCGLARDADVHCPRTAVAGPYLEFHP